MSVYENMAFGLRLRGHAGAEIDRRVHEASEAFGLTGLLPRRPETLSGGERQRVAIVRALAREPKVLLLDEPFSNLDTPMRAQVRLELKRVHQRLEATIVHVTHDQAEALTLGDRVAVMRRGRIEQVASPLTLYDAPANLFVAGFVGWPPMNFVRGALGMAGEVCQFKIEAGSGTGGGRGLALPIPPTLASELSAHVGRTLVMGLRPEDIGPARDHPSEARGTDFESQVEWVEVVGPELHVHLSACGWRCLARWPRQDAPSAGEKVHASVAAGRAHFFDPETGLAIGGRVLL